MGRLSWPVSRTPSTAVNTTRGPVVSETSERRAVLSLPLQLAQKHLASSRLARGYLPDALTDELRVLPPSLQIIVLQLEYFGVQGCDGV